MARLFRLLRVAIVAAAVGASGVGTAASGDVVTDAAVDAAALSTQSAHTLTSVTGSTPVWLLADVHGCKPMSACVSLQTHLASRFGATGGASCFGTHYGIGNAVLHMTNDSLNTIMDANCCATRTQFSGLTSKTRMLMNIDTCARNTSVPQQYVSPLDFVSTPIYTGYSTSMLTTMTASGMTASSSTSVTARSLSPASSSSSSSASSGSSRQVDTEGAARTAPAVTRTAPAATRIAPAVGAELMAGAKDIIFDLGQCCLPYFEFINQNDEHSCCHEGCWHMVDVLGMYFTIEECCADGANQSGTYVVCP